MVNIDNIEIRHICAIDGFFEVVEIQKVVWGDSTLVLTSPHLLKVHVEMGALVLGAFSADGAIIGFAYSFPGDRKGVRMHWSHMLAVLPEYRGSGLGKLRKWKQREAILEDGIGLCCWTFDPLQAVNTRLNLIALGATTNEYLIDAYSSRGGYLDGGMPTDRFVAHWKLDDPRVDAAANGTPERVEFDIDSLPLACRLEKTNGFYMPSTADLSIEEEIIGVPILANINDLRTDHSKMALHWRLTTRDIFSHYFREGYTLIDNLTPEEASLPTFMYILQRQ